LIGKLVDADQSGAGSLKISGCSLNPSNNVCIVTVADAEKHNDAPSRHKTACGA
jgi:hypothetical protein